MENVAPGWILRRSYSASQRWGGRRDVWKTIEDNPKHDVLVELNRYGGPLGSRGVQSRGSALNWEERDSSSRSGLGDEGLDDEALFRRILQWAENYKIKIYLNTMFGWLFILFTR